jgi:hypothetical protein
MLIEELLLFNVLRFTWQLCLQTLFLLWQVRASTCTLCNTWRLSHLPAFHICLYHQQAAFTHGNLFWSRVGNKTTIIIPILQSLKLRHQESRTDLSLSYGALEGFISSFVQFIHCLSPWVWNPANCSLKSYYTELSSYWYTNKLFVTYTLQ